jgi:hypothetical protein
MDAAISARSCFVLVADKNSAAGDLLIGATFLMANLM